MNSTAFRSRQPERLCKLIPTARPDVALLTLTVSGKATSYTVENIGSDDAEHGFRLEKLDASGATVESYDVELFTSNGYHGCTCKGFGRWGHCKHVESLVAIDQAGRLPKPVCRPRNRHCVGC